MSEWKSSRLSNLVSFQKGRKVEVSQYRRDKFAPYLGAGVLSGGEATEYADKSSAVLAEFHDVLMLWDGERSGLVGRGKPGVVSSTVAKLTPKAGIDTTFLYYALDAKFDWIQGRRTGTGVPHVPKDLSRILVLRYPKDLKDQRRIAEILSTVDETIEQTEALIAKTQAIKAGLMHDLFTRGVTPDGKLRPPREEAPQLYKQSPLGWIPREWEVKTTLSCASPLPGSTTIGPFGSNLVASDYRSEGVPVVFVRDVKEAGFQWNSAVYVTPEKADDLSAHTVRSGDILVTKMGLPPCIACSYPPWMPQGVVTADIIRLRPESSEVDVRWLSAALNSDAIKRQVQAITAGVTRPKVTLADFRRLRLASPLKQEQVAIGDRLEQVDTLVLEEIARLGNLRNIRSGLMHDLLTGRVRVNVKQSKETIA